MARPFFFVHLMKTAGTSFRVHAAQHFEADEVFPPQQGVGDFEKIVQYVGVHQFMELTPADRSRIRFYSAHVPYTVARAAVPEAVTITVLRDPVERTLSYLRHSQRDHTQIDLRSLEEIYDDPWHRTRFVDNHQTKMLSMTLEESLRGAEDSMIRRFNPRHLPLPELRQDPAFLDAVRRE